MNGSKLRAVLSGVAVCAALGTFLIGVPLCLVRLLGNPLPSALPAWSSVVAAVESGVLPPGVAIRVVAVVVWIWWSQVALSFAAEAVAACRGRTAQPLPLSACGMQPLMVRLVAIVVAAAGTLGLLTQPVLAATPSFAGISVTLTSGESVGGGAGESSPVSSTGGAMGSSPLAARPSAAALSTSPETPAPPAASAPILAPPTGLSAMPSIASAPVATSESTAPILAPPETAATLAVPLDVGSPPVAPSSMFDVGAPTLSTPPALSPLQHPPPAEVTAAEPAPAALPESGRAAEEIEPSGWVVVQPGDSLWLLAEKHLGDALLWEDIYDLNTGPLPGGGTLRDPNLIHPGWRLRLPPLAARAPSGMTGGMSDPVRTPAGPSRPGSG